MSYVIDDREQAIIHSEINVLGNSNKLGRTSSEEQVWRNKFGMWIYLYNSFSLYKLFQINLYDYNNDQLVQQIAYDLYILIKKNRIRK